jgi:predicted glutamine amidotransferase
LPLNETKPQGGTDSERFFLWIWERVHAVADPSAAMAALLKASRESLVFSSLNFLMSDGETLWAYRDVGDKRLGADETFQNRQDLYTLFTATAEKSAVVCSQPLEAVAKNWQPMAPRTLAVFTPKQLTPTLIKI